MIIHYIDISHTVPLGLSISLAWLGRPHFPLEKSGLTHGKEATSAPKKLRTHPKKQWKPEMMQP